MVSKGQHVSGEALHACVRYSWGLGDRVYALVDAARDRELVLYARHELAWPMYWLFEDNASAHMSEVGPWLIPVAFKSKYPYTGSEYLDLWAEHLGNSAGIMLLTHADPEKLQEHLRDIFRVTDEQGKKYFFRFYDPRVLRKYLPTCTPAEARELFGPVRRILTEAATPGTMLSCSAERDGLKITERTLSTADEGGAAR